MKSIKQRILVPALLTMVVALVVNTAASALANYNSTLSTLNQTMSEAATIAAAEVSASVGKMSAVMVQIADTARLKSTEITNAEKQTILDDKLKLGYFESIGMTNANGMNLTGTDLSDSEYITGCLSQKTPFVTDPFYSEKLQKMAMVVSAPLLEGEKATGVIYAVMDANFLSTITNMINVGETGTAYIVNSTGTTIAYNDPQLVLEQYNTQEEAKSDPDLVALGALEAKMVAGETDFGTYSYGGSNRLMAFAPVPESQGWSLAITASKGEFMASTYNALFLSIALLAVSLLAAAVILYRVSSGIAKPVRLCADRLSRLAEGDLRSPVPQISAKDETGTLAGATESLVSTLNTIISDEGYVLGAMADGNFDVRTQHEEKYVGDFQELLLSIRNINNNLSRTLIQINEAANQVSSGSEQVSSGAQALSQGATEQASAVEELSASIAEISSQVRQNAQSASEASGKANQTGAEIGKSNQRMTDLMKAIEDISHKSSEIGKIIKTIDDIAFQTNILALNAAVEAARAGAAGKGFAVVADEVRNLSGKSAQAAKNTTALIEDSIRAVEVGSGLARETAAAMAGVVSMAQEVVSSIDQISNASSEQANSITQVTLGVDQISGVVQTNSATSEESAAASEELNGQAQMLRDLVGHFKLKNAGAIGQDLSAPYEEAAAVAVGAGVGASRGGSKY